MSTGEPTFLLFLLKFKVRNIDDILPIYDSLFIESNSIKFGAGGFEPYPKL